MQDTSLNTKIDNFFLKADKYKTFLKSQKIDPSSYISTLKHYTTLGRRFIRISPKLKKLEKQLLKKELQKTDLQKTVLKNVFSLPLWQKIANLESYKKGFIYGIDFGSIFVIEALNPKKGERIIDVCCSPGAKLMYILDKTEAGEDFCFEVEEGIGGLELGNVEMEGKNIDGEIDGENIDELDHDDIDAELDCKNIDVELDCENIDGELDCINIDGELDNKNIDKKDQNYIDNNKIEDDYSKHNKKKKFNKKNEVKLIKDPFLFGNDISEARLNITKSLLKKYKKEEKIKLINKDARNLETKDFGFKFDKILVDVECTHDGSFKHILKYINPRNPKKKKNKEIPKNLSKREQKRRALQKKVSNRNTWKNSDFEKNILNPEKIKNLNSLQFEILKNSFFLLKKKGTIIYSTCSLSKNQNEDIIKKFVNFFLEKKIFIEIVDLILEWKEFFGELRKCGFREGGVKGSVRVDPSSFFCGGMFICKMVRLN